MSISTDGSVRLDSGQWVELRLQFPTSGRYASEVVASASAEGSELDARIMWTTPMDAPTTSPAH